MLNYKIFEFEKSGGEFSNLTFNESATSEVFVLIIGEATTRNHLSLYNYKRNTNPLLSKITDELIIYNDVISPNAHSIPSLNKVLTLANNENPNDKFKGSIIQLFNKANYTTYWISNQRPSGIYDTSITGISSSSDKRFFLNTSSNQTPYDENIFAPFMKVLQYKEKKKFIIIHLMGTHGAYSERYTNDFNKFTTIPETKFKHRKAYNFINAYDNAILYNDYIVSKIISEIKQNNTKASLLYLSDHGEEVFQTINLEGHTDDIGSKPMYDIPFMIWLSEKYKQEPHNLVFNTNRRYISEDLIYTLADIAKIKFKEFDSTKSIVNKNFKFKSRIVSDSINYDLKFNN
jgi:heptose-I-phosphate ethanolaminephosphotransferase